MGGENHTTGFAGETVGGGIGEDAVAQRYDTGTQSKDDLLRSPVVIRVLVGGVCCHGDGIEVDDDLRGRYDKAVEES